MTLEQYDALARACILTKRDKVHLINGYLIKKTTYEPPHATVDELCGAELDRVLPREYHARPGKPVRLPATSSEPEPDRSVVRGGPRDYLGRHPGPADVVLIVEVSKTSMEQDRAMATVYSADRIPFYWILNVVDGQVEVYSQPGPTGYGMHEVFAPPQVLPVVIDGAKVGEIPAADILP